MLELLLFLLFLQGEKDSKVCVLEYLYLFLHLNLEILLKGTILKGSISTSAFGCPYVPLARWLYGFGHHFLLVPMCMLCPGLPSESFWHPKDSDCPGWCFWVIQMSTLSLLPSLSPKCSPTFLIRVLTFNSFMIKFNIHPDPRFWGMLRGDSENTHPVSFCRPLYSVKWTALGGSQSPTCEWKGNRGVASSASGPPPPWATVQSCSCLINPLRSILTLVSNDRGAHRSHPEGGKLDG